MEKVTLFRIDMAGGAIEHRYDFTTPVGEESVQQQGGIACSAAVSGGTVYFSTLDGKFRCLDANTFAEIWITDFRHPDLAHNQPVTNEGDPGARAEGFSSPLVINGKVYVGFGEGEGNAFGFLYCLDAATGKVIWLFCTNQFTTGTDNVPNVVLSSSVGGAIPPGYTGFSVRADPLVRGASVWSSSAYHAGLNRIFVGTGNAKAGPLPDAFYGSGLLSLDADTGALKGYFQVRLANTYRPDDEDVDVSSPPTLFRRGAQDIVAFGCKNGAACLLDAASLAMLAHRQLLPKDPHGNPLAKVDPPITAITKINRASSNRPPLTPFWGMFTLDSGDMQILILNRRRSFAPAIGAISQMPGQRLRIQWVSPSIAPRSPGCIPALNPASAPRQSSTMSSSSPRPDLLSTPLPPRTGRRSGRHPASRRRTGAPTPLAPRSPETSSSPPPERNS